ncbi:MAG: LacI family DNA-binding transcriptional regulator [Lachnospiraceae bacterium]
MITIVDVAAEAGVSVATVSRVLNDSYTVSNARKELVMKAIEKTGYVIPQRMKLAQRDAPGKIILIITGTLIGAIIDSIQCQASSHNYQTMTYSYHNKGDLENLNQLLANLREKLAGVILLNSIDNSPEFQNSLEDIPVIQIGEPIFESRANYTVYMDEIKMSYDAAEYLVKQGKKKIALLTMNPYSQTFFSTDKREKGYFLSMLEHYEHVDYSLREYADVTIEGGFEAALKLLERHPDVDSILCTQDAIAMGALHALLTRGIPVTKIQPFSLDYNEVWELFHPFLPYIDCHQEQLGTAAFFMLHNLLTQEVMTDCYQIIPHDIIIKSARPV